MENHPPRASLVQSPTGELKESIRDMVRLQRDYQLSDELFWEIFNTRVLLNEQIDLAALIGDSNEYVTPR